MRLLVFLQSAILAHLGHLQPCIPPPSPRHRRHPRRSLPRTPEPARKGAAPAASLAEPPRRFSGSDTLPSPVKFGGAGLPSPNNAPVSTSQGDWANSYNLTLSSRSASGVWQFDKTYLMVAYELFQMVYTFILSSKLSKGVYQLCHLGNLIYLRDSY